MPIITVMAYRDYDEAVKWYRKAAEQGNSIAIQHLNSLGEYIG